MEVGAVKQAFNNEVILLKKKLKQAKIQIIHKLTRKAKQLTEKKTPEKLKEKLKRKAESAVKEVLIIKKIKARDIAKFIVTHTGELTTYLNRPQVDTDKACARLLLHKSMQEKYKFIRNRFNNVPIKDLFMSRQERLKIKKEAKDKQKNKKKDKINKAVSEKGDWDVEDVNKPINNNPSFDEEDEDNSDIGNNNDMSDDESQTSNESMQSKDSDDVDLIGENAESDKGENAESEIAELIENNEEDSDSQSKADEVNINEDDKEVESVGKFVKLNSASIAKNIPEIKENKIDKKSTVVVPKVNKKENITNVSKKVKDNNKNRNLNEKIQMNKFKKSTEDSILVENKTADPFFITSTGEQYMSLAEPRQPDEVKEIHKQGNRKLRRAVMFGHELKIKPRKNADRNNDFRKNYIFSSERGKSDRHSSNDIKDFHNKNNKFNDKYGSNVKMGDFNGRKFNNNDSRFSKGDEKPMDEKLHPSWEAKKRQSGILPFQGKKIVFDES